MATNPDIVATERTSAPTDGTFADVTFESLMRLAAGHWKLIVGCALVGFVVLVAFSYSITPAYRATVVVTPVNNDLASTARSAMGGQLGGLAALAGVNLGGSDSKEEYLAFLGSRAFARAFIEERKLIPVLYADRNPLLAWLPEDEPTLAGAARKFQQDVFDFDEDRKTRLVTIRVTWTDQQTAAKWANEIVASVNERLRARAIQDSEKNLEYLKSQLRQNDLVATEQAIGRLIESEVRNTMLARGREQYAFKVIDPASVPDREDKVRPRRALLGALGLFVGGMLGLLVALVKVRRSLRAGR
jgi:uncharacterized protein involved in exopolysaccharide biosynthesis